MKNHNYITIIAGLIIAALVATGTYYILNGVRKSTDIIIADHIQMLSSIFTTINTTCGIIDFEHSRNYVDFLNVKSFVGSEVGSMNLENPQHWQGPYVDDNPTIQEKLYVVLKTKNGYYLVPDDGVELRNGAIIGKDLVLDNQTNIELLIQTRGQLNYKGRPLAARISTIKDKQSRQSIAIEASAIE
jgi:hypothetical protein